MIFVLTHWLAFIAGVLVAGVLLGGDGPRLAP